MSKIRTDKKVQKLIERAKIVVKDIINDFLETLEGTKIKL